MAAARLPRSRITPAVVFALAMSAVAAWQIARSIFAPAPAPSMTAEFLQAAGASSPDGRRGVPEADDRTAARASALLRAEPLSAEAYGALGLAAARADDAQAAARLMEIAAEGQRRDGLVQGWLFADDLRRGDPNAAMARLDAILRARPQALDDLTLALGPVLADPAARTALVGLLAERPPWRTRFVDVAVRLWREPAGLVALLSELQATPSGLDPAELKPYLTKLLVVGAVDDAYEAWLRSLPEQARASLPYLYNGHFKLPPTQAPFDWRTPQTAGAKVSIAETDGVPSLSVGFFGSRLQGQPATHDLVLAPGDYRLTGRVRAERLRSARGVRWRLACLSNPDGSLGVSQSFEGAFGWRDFAVDFTVPDEGCPAQSLGLEVDARTASEAEASGLVSFSALDIGPR